MPCQSSVAVIANVELLPAAIYARQSDPNKRAEDGMDKTLSLDVQEGEAFKAAARLDFDVQADDVYSEQITSEVWDDRPELARMIASVKAKKYKAIIVYKYNRIARDPVQLSAFVQMMRTKGVRVISATESEPADDMMGEFMTFLYGFMAKIEKNNILQNTSRTKKRLLDEGKLMGSGKCQYGYVYNKKLRTREVDPEQAMIVVRIFRWASEGYSLRQIAEALNVEGIPGPRDTWKINTLSVLIRDPSYWGSPFLANKRRQTDKRASTGSGRKLDARNDPSEYRAIGGPTPKIVDRNTWDKAQEQLSDRKKRPRAKLDLFLRGHIFCRKCGAAMSASRERSGALFYRCNRSAHDRINKCGTGTHRVEDVESYVWSKVLTARESPQELKAKVAAALQTHERPDNEAQLTFRRARLEKLSTKLAKLIDRLTDLDDPVMVEAIERNIRSVRDDINRESEIIAELVRSLEVAHSNAEIIRAVEARLLREDGIKEDADSDEKSKVLDALSIRIECSRSSHGQADIGVLLFGNLVNKMAYDEISIVPGYSSKEGQTYFMRTEGRTRDTLSIADADRLFSPCDDSPSVRKKFSR